MIVYLARASASASVVSSQDACSPFQESSATTTNRASPWEVWTSFAYQGAGRRSAAMNAAKLASCAPFTKHENGYASLPHSWLPMVIHQAGGPCATASM